MRSKPALLKVGLLAGTGDDALGLLTVAFVSGWSETGGNGEGAAESLGDPAASDSGVEAPGVFDVVAAFAFFAWNFLSWIRKYEHVSTLRPFGR